MSKSPAPQYLVFNSTNGGICRAHTLKEAQEKLSDCLIHPNWKEGGIYELVQYTKQIETISFSTWTKDQTS